MPVDDILHTSEVSQNLLSMVWLSCEPVLLTRCPEILLAQIIEEKLALIKVR